MEAGASELRVGLCNSFRAGSEFTVLWRYEAVEGNTMYVQVHPARRVLSVVATVRRLAHSSLEAASRAAQIRMDFKLTTLAHAMHLAKPDGYAAVLTLIVKRPPYVFRLCPEASSALGATPDGARARLARGRRARGLSSSSRSHFLLCRLQRRGAGPERGACGGAAAQCATTSSRARRT